MILSIQTKKAKQIKRALAVKMILSGKFYQKIIKLLEVSLVLLVKGKTKLFFRN